MRKNRRQKLSSLVDQVCMDVAGPESAAIFYIMKHWAKIAGAELSKFSQPIKLSKSGKAVILIVGVLHPSLSIAIQSEENNILERIAKYVGYRMIKKLRIKHSAKIEVESFKNSEPQKPKHVLTQDFKSKIEAEMANVRDPEMLQILRDLYSSLFDDFS